jgi:hypothetical protein
MFRVSVPARITRIGRRILSGRSVEILGWILFVLSALGFIVSSLRTGDLPGLAGGVLFLAGCLAFLLALLSRRT